MAILQILQHVPFEGPAHIATWAWKKGHEVHITRLDLAEPLPPWDRFDWLVVVGGPMNIYEDQRYSWLKDERAFLEDGLRHGKKILGICLGAQLLADALGSKVYGGPEKEIGWFPVELISPRASLLFSDFPPSFLAFHWHGDTFEIPKGAVHVAWSQACGSQAFVFEERAVGLQFHLESTLESVGGLIHHCSSELVPGAYVQDVGTIERKTRESVKQAQRLLESLLDRLFCE